MQVTNGYCIINIAKSHLKSMLNRLEKHCVFTTLTISCIAMLHSDISKHLLFENSKSLHDDQKLQICKTYFMLILPWKPHNYDILLKFLHLQDIVPVMTQ